MPDYEYEEKALCFLKDALKAHNWKEEKREAPDFVIEQNNSAFGLEITKCYSGDYEKKKLHTSKESKKTNEILKG